LKNAKSFISTSSKEQSKPLLVFFFQFNFLQKGKQ
jgi:hypothetical protein